jgi:hypothetical protein
MLHLKVSGSRNIAPMLSNRFLYDSNLRQVFDPSLQDYEIPDYDNRMLHSASKIHFEVEYLSVANNPHKTLLSSVMGVPRKLFSVRLSVCSDRCSPPMFTSGVHLCCSYRTRSVLVMISLFAIIFLSTDSLSWL